MHKMRNQPESYKRFWSAIAITVGLTIFFFGVSLISAGIVTGWFNIGWFNIVSGGIILGIGLYIAPFKPTEWDTLQYFKSETPAATTDNDTTEEDDKKDKTWFDKDVENIRVFLGKGNQTDSTKIMSDSMSGVYTALNTYQTNVRYVTTLLFSLIAIVVAMFSISRLTGQPNPDEFSSLLELAGGSLLIITFAIGLVSIYAITRYYNVYVSALLYATEIHEAVGVLNFWWLERIYHLINETGSPNRDEFIRRRTASRRDSHFIYSWLLSFLSFIFFLAGLIILIMHPLSDTSTFLSFVKSPYIFAFGMVILFLLFIAYRYTLWISIRVRTSIRID